MRAFILMGLLLAAAKTPPPPEPSLADQIKWLGERYQITFAELEAQNKRQNERWEAQSLDMGRYIINLMRACGTNHVVEIDRAGIGTNWHLNLSINTTNTNRVVITYSLNPRP